MKNEEEEEVKKKEKRKNKENEERAFQKSCFAHSVHNAWPLFILYSEALLLWILFLLSLSLYQC